jgi:hypothetical protein
MTIADFLSCLITLFGILNFIAYTLISIRYKDQRGLNILVAFSSLWLAFIFGLNSLHIVINASGLTGGRPATIGLLATIMSKAIYSFRNKGC